MDLEPLPRQSKKLTNQPKKPGLSTAVNLASFMPPFQLPTIPPPFTLEILVESIAKIVETDCYLETTSSWEASMPVTR
jgi:hypothetical protein